VSIEDLIATKKSAVAILQKLLNRCWKSNTWNRYPITLRAPLFYRVPVNLTPPLDVISSNYGHSFND